MVKQQVWIINSALVLLIFLFFGVQIFLRQPIPAFRNRKVLLIEEEQKRRAPLVVNLEKIYQNDLFDTYTAPPEQQPVQKNLVTPIPTLNITAPQPPPAPQKPPMLPPLNISIKGIILSSSLAKSIAVIADQTNKETIYHIGDTIQDGQIIKINTNKVVFLRSNGQLETFYLRKPDKMKPGLDLWSYAVKKIDDFFYHVDPQELSKGIASLGEVVEALNLVTEYAGDKPVGIRVDSISHHPLGKQLGLQENDVILSINGLSTTGTKELIRAHDELLRLPLDSRIEVAITRGSDKKTLAYLLKKLEKPFPFEGEAPNKAEGPGDEGEFFKVSKEAERREHHRQFAHDHRTAEQHDVARSDIRKRMMDNMRARANNRRVR